MNLREISECFDISCYSLFYIHYCLLFCLTLADASGQAGAFCNPVTVLPGIYYDLSHAAAFWKKNILPAERGILSYMTGKHKPV